MFDIFFISYNEPNADNNWKQLKSRFPLAQRIDGIQGIHNAHIEAAKRSFTKLFWVVDADAELLESFDFNYKTDDWDVNCVHVCKSINPVNDLEYGYGAVKLLPKNLTMNMDITKIDITTGISVNFKLIPVVSNITQFNTDPFNSWKSAFRECVKLSSRIIDRQNNCETYERLDIWCTKGKERKFGEFVLSGANCGKLYGEQNKNDINALRKINDFEWLTYEFKKYHGTTN